MKNQFLKFLNRAYLVLSALASHAEDKDDAQFKRIAGFIGAFAAIFLYIGYAIFYYWFNERHAALVCLIASFSFTVGCATYRLARSVEWHVYILLSIHLIAVGLVHVLLGGFMQSGMIIIWLFFPPLTSLILQKPIASFYWLLAATIAIFLLWIFYLNYLRPENNFPRLALAALGTVNIVGFGALTFSTLYYFFWQNEILTKLVMNEQAKSESLLLNILPREIATILKNENRIIADQFENASILFADVVNFTPMSASMTPTELVELLNEVYSHFDTLVEKYELEKIKTIGDCYMVAAGVPRRRPDHALVLTQLALDIRDFVSQHEFHGRQLKFRIGINSGSVVAGVIGRKKFAYDLWGDAVNTASRMESHGSGGFIQITEDTYNLINHDFNCESRGKVNVKGKGEINVWYVIDKLSLQQG